MFTNSLNLLFMNTMMIGVMVSLCSNSWLMIWAGLEISLMSFIPLINENKILSSQSSMKYFIIQSMSSSILIMALSVSTMKESMWSMISISLMLKMGVAPLHNWVISVIEGMNEINMLILLTMLKLPPLMMLSYNNSMNMLFSMTSLVWGSMSGLSQFSIKKMLAYSSIFNMGFIIQSTKFTSMWMSFMIVYSMTITFFMLTMKKLSIKFINQASWIEENKLNKMNMWIITLSMMGLPPLIGFLPKLSIMELMMKEKQLLMLVIMISTSMLVSFFYMRMSYSSFMSHSLTTKWNMKTKSKTNSIWSTISMLTLPLIMSTKCFK
uniref:NADH dehydrogenase subunit 2 n=1 Tax=Xestocephalus biprocessus TaxID=3112134 RepID=UPI002E776F01|nr:NADH dehydrogenase subunit 2 [Xestocephalus biprocessus]WRK21284.1 NADH dehydrogenase subunit 2 [Xestocephalus biprocessus]